MIRTRFPHYQLVVLAIFALLFSSISLADEDYSDDLFGDNFLDGIFPTFSKEELRSYVDVSTVKMLENRGLDILVENFESFFHLFDNTTYISHHLSEEENFNVLNDMIDAIKRSFIMTANQILNSRNAPTGEITPSSMASLLEIQETHFKDLLRKKVPKGLNLELLEVFFTRIHLVFDTVKRLYEMAFEMLPAPLKFSWMQLQFVLPFLELIPTNHLLDHSNFEWFLLTPAITKKALHDLIVFVFAAERSHLTKVVFDLVKMYKWDTFLRPNHAEV